MKSVNCKHFITYSHTDLRKFGLNPLHWLLTEWSQTSPDQALFIHIDDPEIQLKAKLSKSKTIESAPFRIEELLFAI